MKTQLYINIEKAFITLSQYDERLAEVWYNEIYGLDGDLINEMVNEEVLENLETDVMRVIQEND